MRFKLTFLFMVVFFFSCKHEIETPYWTLDIVAPIAKTELKLTDLLKDSNVDLDTNTNDELLLVYKMNSIDTNLNDFISTDDLSFQNSDIITIPEFEIPDVSLEFEASLGQIITGTAFENTFLNGATMNMNQTYNIIPPIKDFNLDLIPEFNELQIESGIIEIKMINNLPTTIGNLTFKLMNQDPNNEYPNDDIINIFLSNPLEKGDSTNITQNLNNTFFTNLLKLSAIDLSLNGNGLQTVIDTSIGIKFNILIYDVVVSKIEGVIQQSIPLDSIKEETYINIESLNIKKLKIDSGFINIDLNTPLNMPLELNFYSPNIIPNDTLILTINQGSGSGIIDITGKEILFSGENNDTVNSFYYELYGLIPPTTIYYDASVDDQVEYELSAFIKPQYAIADIDEIIIEIEKDSFQFDFFKELDIGTDFSIESAKMMLSIENSIGVGCNYNLNINSENLVEGTSSLVIINDNINQAQFDHYSEVLIPSYFESEFNNLANIINIKPDLLVIDGEVTLNSGEDKFVVYEEGLSISPNIEIPLSFIATDLVLSDTSTIEIPTEIDNGTLKLIIDNGYPINTQVNIYFLDKNYQELENYSHLISSGQVNNDGRIYEPTRSIFEITLNQENIEDIKYVHYLTTFETSSQTEYNKIYSDYIIQVQIVAKYKANSGTEK